MGNTSKDTLWYVFESGNRLPFVERNSEELTSDVKEFIRRLGGPSVELAVRANPEHKKTITDYVLANHRAVKWYQDKRDKMRDRRIGYALLSIALLAITPVLIFFVTKSVGDSSSSAEIWLSQATALAGGLIAAQRAISAWVQKSFAASNFVQAASALKANIYAFEGDWNGKAFDNNALTVECREALLLGIRAAREIIAKQRDDFFAASAPPAFDIANALTKGAKDASVLFGAYRSPAFQRMLSDQKALQTTLEKKAGLRVEIKELNEHNKLIDDLIQRLEDDISKAESSGDTAELTERVKKLRNTRTTNEDALIEQAASLASLASDG